MEPTAKVFNLVFAHLSHCFPAPSHLSLPSVVSCLVLRLGAPREGAALAPHMMWHSRGWAPGPCRAADKLLITHLAAFGLLGCRWVFHSPISQIFHAECVPVRWLLSCSQARSLQMPWSTPKGNEGTPRAKIQASLETFLEAGAAKGYAEGEAGVTATPKLCTNTYQ